MSENKDNVKMNEYLLAYGVFKVDFRAAGYPDLLRLAKKWAEDQNFHELIVRKVSESNFGIQFVYISKNPRGENIQKYKNEIREIFGKGDGGVYALDYQEAIWQTDGDTVHPDSIVVLKPYNIYFN